MWTLVLLLEVTVAFIEEKVVMQLPWLVFESW